MRMDSNTTDLRYHSLSGTISFRLQECYGLLSARPDYMACCVESLCIFLNQPRQKILYYLFPDVIIEDPDWVEEVLKGRMLHLRLQQYLYVTKNTER